MTETSWRAQKRESAVHDPTPVHERYNRVPCNENIDSHVASVLEFYSHEMNRGNRLGATGNANGNKGKGKFSIIAVGEGATAVCSYLNHNWNTWRHCIKAIAIADGYIWDKPYLSWNSDFRAFFSSVRKSPLFPIREPSFVPMTPSPFPYLLPQTPFPLTLREIL